MLQVVRFRPISAGFDARLREVLVPGLLCLPGIRGVFAGRIGPDDDGPRLIATLWSSAESMAAQLVADDAPAGVDQEHMRDLGGAEVETLAVAVAVAPARPADVGILRLVRGRTRPGLLEEYVRQARQGTAEDRERGIGPQALYLATDGSSRFATLSLWDAWDHVEAATGSHALSADRTRHAELLLDWVAEHYEVVPGVAVAVAGGDETDPR